MTKPPTFVSLYAGAGGLDIGFALAGFEPVWANELSEWAVHTYDAAFKRLSDELPHLRGTKHTAVAGSIDDGIELPSRGVADLVIGGPPCQGFSVAGKMDPRDSRSKHVFRFLEVVDQVQPQAFVMENVKSLYTSIRWAQIREALVQRAESLGYKCSFFLANAAHYGVPQARERMFLIGVKSGSPVFPDPVTAEAPPTVREALETLPPLGEPGNDSFCNAKVTFAKNPVLRRSPWAGMMFNGAGRPLDLEAPSLTLPASMGGNKTPIVDQRALETGEPQWILEYHERLWSGGRPLQKVPNFLRRLTVEEAAALQTFPVGMDWHGPQSSKYSQIGNAVPPRLAYHVATALRSALS